MSFTVSLEDIVNENAGGLLAAHASWGRVPLGLVFQVQNGFPFESGRFNSTGRGVRLLRIRDVIRGSTETYYDGPFSPEHLVQAGDIVIGMDGDFNVRRWPGPQALLNQRVCRLVPLGGYSPALIPVVLQGYLDAINARTSSITVKHLSSRTVEGIPLPLPPAGEQERLADSLGSFVSRLDAAVASLEQAQARLKTYRASVLKAAVQARLVPTEAELAWQEGRDYEPASVLLDRILAERRLRWEEAELERMTKAGKRPKDDRWKAKYQEPGGPVTAGLPDLPEGWCWASPAQLASEDRHALAIGPFGSNLKVSDYRSTGVPLVFVRHIRSGTFDAGETRIFVDETKARELQAHWVRPGDILVTKMGDPPGDCCVYPRHRPAGVITADCIKLTLDRALVHRSFYLHAFRSALVQRQIQRASRGVAQRKVSLERFRPIAIPVAPPAEQARLAEAVDRLLSIATDCSQAVEKEQKRFDRLRQGVLRMAFEGKLVDQDPADEPAEALLARIRAERPPVPMRRSRGQKRKPAS